MAFPSRDPKGYYALLGLEPGAGADAVKSAFRKLAKEWHPDRNPSPEAAAQFHKINAAYQVLNDDKARATYDRDGETFARQAAEKAYQESAERSGQRASYTHTNAHERAHDQHRARQQRQQQQAKTEKPKAAPRRDKPKTQKPQYDVGTAVGFLGCSDCGRITAQPRYLVFEEVRGRGFKAERIPVHGVFCADCAEKEAIRSSLYTWVNGWWAIPMGPVYSIAALIRNLFGGIKPKDANAKLLVQQAKAFLNRGEYDVARAVAEQARAFVHDDQSRKDVDGLLTGLNNRLPKKLRNRWPLFGRAFVLQSAPFAAVFLMAMAAYMIWPVVRGDSAATPTSAPPMETAEPDAPRITDTPVNTAPGFDIDSLHHVASKQVVLRNAPTSNAPVIATLDRFTTVQPLDMQPGALWVRVIAPDGVIGYATTKNLGPGPGWRAQRQWCADNSGPRPDNGALLKITKSGRHTLNIANKLPRDVLFKLKNLDGKTAASVYLHAGGSTVLGNIPDGAYNLMYASGENFSTPCGLFLSNMEAMSFPKPEIMAVAGTADMQAKTGTSLSVTLHPIGSGESPVVAASINDFNSD